MSKYLLDKFLYTVDRDPELVERYRDDPAGHRGLVGGRRWRTQILNCTDDERSTWLAFDDEERRALREHDHVALFEMGAHPFLTLTLFIAMFERDHGPLEYQIAYGRAMEPPAAALPGHRHLIMRAALLHAYGARRRAGRAARARAGAGETLVEVQRRAHRPARPAVRQRHLLLRPAAAAVRARRARGRRRRGVGRLPARHPGLVRHHGRDGARPTAAWPSGAPCRPRTWCRSPTDVADAAVAAIGTSGIAAWMAADLAGRGCSPASGWSCWGPAARSARWRWRWPEHLGAGRRGRGLPVGLGRAERARRPEPTRSCVLQPDETGPDWPARLIEAAGGPVDVVIDPVFGEPAAAAALALGPGGRLVNLGGAAGDLAEFSSAVLRGRTIGVLGYTNNAISAGAAGRRPHRGAAAGRAAGAVSVDHRVLPLAEIRTAWSLASGSGPRIVVAIDSSDGATI